MSKLHYLGYDDINDYGSMILCGYPDEIGVNLEGNPVYLVENLRTNDRNIVQHTKQIDNETYEKIQEKLANGSELEDCIRICEKCGKVITDGFTDTCDAYCSIECMGMTYEEYNAQYMDNEDCCHWTEWE